MTQGASEVGSVDMPAPNEFRLAGFRGEGYDRGRSLPIQLLWLASRSLLFQWWIPNRIRVAVLRSFGARIGAGALIRHDVKIHWPWKLEVGANSWIGEGVWILNLEPVRIGANTCISQDVFLCTGSHDRRSPTFEFDNGPIDIGDNSWIAARATVLRNVRIGHGCTVGANALVTKNVIDGTMVLAPRGTAS